MLPSPPMTTTTKASTITPIYGAKGAESRFIPYLSEHYVEMLSYTTTEAKRLDLSVDMATGTGWPKWMRTRALP